MADHHVEVRAYTHANADQVWNSIADFCAPWHPMVQDMAREVDANGHLIRAFHVEGDATLYRERLTYYSASDRVMNYTHLSGIDGVTRYSARLSVTPHPPGCEITMTAEITAPEPRARQIADGTRAIFETGTQSLAHRHYAQSQSQDRPAQPHPTIRKVTLPDAPALTLDHTGGDGDTLCLLLHGIGGHRSNWRDQLGALGPICPVAALDLRGYGDSDLGSNPSDIDAYCADILRVQQAFGAKKLILCGLSYGAWIATSFALRYPTHLRALVLAGGCTGMSEATPEARTAFRNSREAPLRAGQTPADFASAVVDIIAGPDAHMSVRQQLLQSMAAIPTATYQDALQCFTNSAETFDFSTITMPVLMMTGEHDRLAPPDEIRGVADRIHAAAPYPDIRLEILKEAGHVCNLERPDAFNAILQNFVARVLA